MNKWPIPAVAAVIIRNEEILLIQRGEEPSRGKWSIPGGRVEWGESLTDAVKREVKEETGLDIAVDSVAAVFDLIVKKDDEISFHYVIIDYYAHPAGGTLQHGDDAVDVRWVPYAELHRYELTEHLSERLHEMGIAYWSEL